MEKQKIIKSTMHNGITVGLVLIVIQLIMYFFDIKPFGMLNMVLIIIFQIAIFYWFIYFFTKKFRDSTFEGVISYSNALLHGFMLIFFASIILSFFIFILNQFIDPDLAKRTLDQAKELTEKMLLKFNASEDQIEEAIRQIDEKGISSPLKLAIDSIISTSIFGFIISLIAAAFLKKSQNPFEAKPE